MRLEVVYVKSREHCVESKMESSSDDDSVLDGEDTGPRVGDIFNDYSQHSPSTMSKDSHFAEVHTSMPSFEDCFDYSRSKKKRMYEDSSSSSSFNDDDQHCSNASNSKQASASKDDASMSKHDTVKRRKLNSGNAIDSGEQEKYKCWEGSTKNADCQADKSKGNDSSLHVGKGQRMLEKMGYHPGLGLGKYSQGRVEPIQLVVQRGRRGIGHYVPELTEASLKWDPTEEEIKMVEDMEWLPNVHSCMLTNEDMTSWMKLGQKKRTIDDETTFCDSEIVTQVTSSKAVFDKLDKIEMRKARTRSNPYETIRNAGFLNRAAVKMANINKTCNFMFTDSKNLNNDELLYFADVCAGPGGFSEYILSRKKWHAKGFGFTLKNENDFTLDEFFAGPCETFHPFYGSKDNGDVFDPKNQEEFRALVMKHTHGKGVHFMMSDGGFSVDGQENIQEILSKQLYLCQCLVALMIVRTGGHFVTKLFDLFTPFSAGLVYLMYRCFDSVCIFKPNSSRPANSERYLICKRKKPDTQATMEYLSRVNRSLLKADDNNDVIHLISLDKLEADEAFFKYLRHSNKILGSKQVVNLLKIAAFCENESLSEPKQADMRKECLKYWELSGNTRTRPHNIKPQDKIKEILGNRASFMKCDARKLTVDNARTAILNQPYDWYFVPCASGQYVEEDKAATFYLGMGRTRTYRYVRGKWESIKDKLELPPNTLVYAELVYEARWTGKNFTKSRALHILDAYMLGGEDVSKKYIVERHKLINILCDALWKPLPHDYVCVRAKEIFMFGPDFEEKLRIAQRHVKSMSVAYEFPKSPFERVDENDVEPLYCALNSVQFLRSVVPPWRRNISQKTNYFYVHNFKTNETQYEIRRPIEAEANFMQTFESRIIWYWQQESALNMTTLVEMLKNPSQNV